MTLPLPLGGVRDPNVRQALERIAREFPVTVTAVTATVTAGVGAVSASDHLFTSGTVRITGGPGITVGSDANGVVISGAVGTGSLIPAGNTVGTTNSLAFSKNIGLAGGPNVTLSQVTGAASSNVTISAGGGGAGFVAVAKWGADD